MSHVPVTIKPDQIAGFDRSRYRFANGAVAVVGLSALTLGFLVGVELVSIWPSFCPVT